MANFFLGQKVRFVETDLIGWLIDIRDEEICYAVAVDEFDDGNLRIEYATHDQLEPISGQWHPEMKDAVKFFTEYQTQWPQCDFGKWAMIKEESPKAAHGFAKGTWVKLVPPDSDPFLCEWGTDTRIIGIGKANYNGPASYALHKADYYIIDNELINPVEP